MSQRTVKEEFSYPHPGDKHLTLRFGQTINGEWAVWTNNTCGGDCWGHYFQQDELAAYAYFHRRVSELLGRQAESYLLVAEEAEARIAERDAGKDTGW